MKMKKQLLTLCIFLILRPAYGQWAIFPVERYDYYKRTNAEDVKVFAGIGKLYISLMYNKIEFVGVRYKDQVTFDDNKGWIEQNGTSSTNPIFDIAFSDYTLTDINKIENNAVFPRDVFENNKKGILNIIINIKKYIKGFGA